jgi:hypothetical protein
MRQHTSGYLRCNCGARPHQHTSAYVSIRQHTSAYVSIRQHTSAYASIRQHTCVGIAELDHIRYLLIHCVLRLHTSAYVSIRQHTSAYACTRRLSSDSPRPSPAYVSIRQHASAYASIRQHAPAHVGYLLMHRVLRLFSTRFTAAPMLYCCFTAALLLLYCSDSPAYIHTRFTAAPMLYCCFTAALLL